MRLIDAHKLQKAIYEHKTVRSITKDKVVEMIKEQPTADHVNHGRWIDHQYKEFPIGRYECSVCGARHDMPWDFCPNCGARNEVEE